MKSTMAGIESYEIHVYRKESISYCIHNNENCIIDNLINVYANGLSQPINSMV